MPRPFSDRDAVFTKRAEVSEDAINCMLWSVDHPDYPPRKNYLRIVVQGLSSDMLLFTLCRVRVLLRMVPEGVLHTFIGAGEAKGILTKVLLNFALKNILDMNKKAYKVLLKECVNSD